MPREPLFQVGGGGKVEQGFTDVVELVGREGVEAGEEVAGNGAEAATKLADHPRFFVLMASYDFAENNGFFVPDCGCFHRGFLFFRRKLVDLVFVLLLLHR